MKTDLSKKYLRSIFAMSLLLGVWTSSHAGILDMLKGSDKPIVLERTSDMKKTMALAIKESDPVFKVRGDKITKIGISAFQVKFITDSSLSQTRKNIGSGNEVRAAVQFRSAQCARIPR